MPIVYPRETTGTIDVTYHATRMGLHMPVHVEVSTYRELLAVAVQPDRDTFLMIDAICESIDAAIERSEPAHFLPFHFDSTVKGKQTIPARAYVYVFTDSNNGDAPWLLVSSTPLPNDPESKPEASAD